MYDPAREREYYRAREAAEWSRAATAMDGRVREIHAELASYYASLTQLPGANKKPTSDSVVARQFPTDQTAPFAELIQLIDARDDAWKSALADIELSRLNKT